MFKYIFALLISVVAHVADVARAEENPAVALALVVDSSESISPSRWLVQMEGYSYAFRDSRVLETIESLGEGGIVVMFVAYSGPREQCVLLDWYRVHDHASALALSEIFGTFNQPWRKGGTSVSGGIASAIDALQHVPYQVERKIVDVSGDGKTRDSAFPNSPKSPTHEEVRARAVALGITINGLPILGDEFEIDRYYAEEVITPDGFIEVVRDGEDVDAFSEAIVRKLVRELLASTAPY